MKIITNKQQKQIDQSNILKLAFAMQTTYNDIYTTLYPNLTIPNFNFLLKATDIYYATNANLETIKTIQYHTIPKPTQPNLLNNPKNTMQFKHNKPFTCNIKGTNITDAKVSIDPIKNYVYICQNKRKGNYNAPNKLGYKYSWRLKKYNNTHPDITNIKPLTTEKTFDNPQINDEYKDRDGDSRFVLGMAGRVIFLSWINDKNYVGVSYTKEELIRNDYTIVQPTLTPEIEELTVAEVCKLLGKTIKIVKN